MIEMRKVSMFVWNGLVIATNETDAKKAIRKLDNGEPYEWGEQEIRPLTKKVARCVSGDG